MSLIGDIESDVVVTGRISIIPSFQTKEVTPGDAPQYVNPDVGYDALSSVTVHAVQSEEASVTPTTLDQVVVPSVDKYLKKVTVKAIQTEEMTVSENGTIEPSNGKYFSRVIVNVNRGVFPQGVKNIDANGSYDVTDYAGVVVNVPTAEPIEEYDGSVTVGPAVDLISFTIDGTSYQAERGMTWREWCSSSYNTKGLTPEDDTESAFLVDSSQSYMLAYNNGSSVSSARDTIETGGVYVMTDYV